MSGEKDYAPIQHCVERLGTLNVALLALIREYNDVCVQLGRALSEVKDVFIWGDKDAYRYLSDFIDKQGADKDDERLIYRDLAPIAVEGLSYAKHGFRGGTSIKFLE